MPGNTGAQVEKYITPMENLQNLMSMNYKVWSRRLRYCGFNETQAQEFVSAASVCIIELVGSGNRDPDIILRNIDLVELAKQTSLPMDKARIGLITLVPLILSHFGSSRPMIETGQPQISCK